MTDEELLKQISAGNKKAFEEFVMKYKNKAFSLLRSICKNNLDAEEALQDVFMKIANYSSTYRGDAKVSSWFYQITYRTGLQYVSTRKKYKSETIDEFLADKKLGIEENFGDSIKQELIIKLVNELPEKISAIISAFYFNEMTIEEISEAFKISPSDVKTSLHRGRKQLLEIIKSKNLEKELRWN